jgi:hypothetical protein
MLGPHGNPQAKNLFEIVKYLQEIEGVQFEVRPKRAASRTKRRLSRGRGEPVEVTAGRQLKLTAVCRTGQSLNLEQRWHGIQISPPRVDDSRTGGGFSSISPRTKSPVRSISFNGLLRKAGMSVRR